MAASLSLKNSHSLLAPALCLVGLNVLLGAAPCVASIYTSSAHGNSTTGVNRTGLNNATSVDYAIGNCAHCHEQHASVEGVEGGEPVPTGGPDRYLGMALEENLCTHCHGLPAGNGAGGLPDDIKTDISKTGGRHNMAISDSAHLAHETQSQITNNKHVECTDCHNPHAAGKTKHTPGGETVATEIAATSPLYKTTGVVPTFSGANWTAPTYSAVQTATKEYQVCFKCHSGAVGNPATWSSTSGAAAWTDVGLEFSPGNKSGHPVVTGLNNYTNSVAPKALAASQLLAPWNVNIGTQTMYCSDCHASDSTVAGPHGSSIKWMLAGTNNAWPYNTRPYNGTSTGGTYWTVTFATNNPTKPFCWNCHPDTKASGANNAHSSGFHGSLACVTCHIRVPHGGKVSRLIAADDFANFTNLPSRYTANGDGLNSSGTTASQLKKYTKKAAPGTYVKTDCKTTCGPPDHQTTGTEYW